MAIEVARSPSRPTGHGAARRCVELYGLSSGDRRASSNRQNPLRGTGIGELALTEDTTAFVETLEVEMDTKRADKLRQRVAKSEVELMKAILELRQAEEIAKNSGPAADAEDSVNGSVLRRREDGIDAQLAKRRDG